METRRIGKVCTLPDSWSIWWRTMFGTKNYWRCLGSASGLQFQLTRKSNIRKINLAASVIQLLPSAVAAHPWKQISQSKIAIQCNKSSTSSLSPFLSQPEVISLTVKGNESSVVFIFSHFDSTQKHTELYCSFRRKTKCFHFITSFSLWFDSAICFGAYTIIPLNNKTFIVYTHQLK